jgi:hypothetical protein
MKIDLASMLRQARQAIDPSLDHGGFEWQLEVLEMRVRSVRGGGMSLDAFADEYMIRPRPASCDTLPKGQDAKQGLAGTESGAVPKADAQPPQDNIS